LPQGEGRIGLAPKGCAVDFRKVTIARFNQ
jgi:hypothetical protein